MSTVFLIIGAIFVGIAGLIHIAIFLFESVLWNRPATWKRFGVKTQEEADVLRRALRSLRRASPDRGDR